MPKRTRFTHITPLPPQVSREVAVAMLHNHDEMIELNPLVVEHHAIKTPRDAPADEFLDCVWQELTDKIHYLPGGIMKGKVSYKACFHDTAIGLQTHIYAPMGLDIREKWSIGGSLPGEPPEARELGLNTPTVGLYLREDCDMKCNILLTGFVKKNLDNSHKVLVERILKKAERVQEHLASLSPSTSNTNESVTSSARFQKGSHMAQSQFISSPRSDTFPSPLVSPIRNQFPDLSIHPAFRNDPLPESNHRQSTYTPPPHYSSGQEQRGQPQDVKGDTRQQPSVAQSASHSHQSLSAVGEQRSSHQPARKEFLAELPGSLPSHHPSAEMQQDRYQGSISEMSTTETLQPRPLDHRPYTGTSQEGSVVSALSGTSNSYAKYHSHSGQRNGANTGADDYAELPSPLPNKPSFQHYQATRTGRF